MSQSLFSKRQKTQSGQVDPLQYKNLPEPFRKQVIHILNDTIGKWTCMSVALGWDPTIPAPNQWWTTFHKNFIRKKGEFALVDARLNPRDQCFRYLMEASTTDTLDLIDFLFAHIDELKNVGQDVIYERHKLSLLKPDSAIAELNERFREHNVGYEFSNGELIRIDSRYLHAETVQPALQLLHDAGAGFAGPLQEFLKADDYHRKGEQKDAISSGSKPREHTEGDLRGEKLAV